jgi:rhodanese-related sulfurtransferase
VVTHFLTIFQAKMLLDLNNNMKNISPKELHRKIVEKDDFQLIDIREAHEIEICTIGGTAIPMGEILTRHELINKNIPVVIYCRTGSRALSVIDALERHYSFSNLHNLEGGIVAYSQQVDSSLETY